MLAYSKSTGGFYSTEIHGNRKVVMGDPTWTPPKVDITLQPGESYQVDGQIIRNPNEVAVVLNNVVDVNAITPSVEIYNPECKIPSDAIEITEEYYILLLEGQSSGKIIMPDVSGFPILQDQPPPTKEQILIGVRKKKQEIRDNGMLVDGILFDTDQNARIAYSELQGKFLQNPEYVCENWKASDGVWLHKMDLALFTRVMEVGEQHLANVFKWQKDQEDLINN